MPGDAPAQLIVRIWRTRVDPAQVDVYRQFAETVSLPMFRQQQGFLGVLFAESKTNGEHAVISFWDQLASVAALDTSPTYQATVRRIEDTGFLLGESSIEVLEVKGGSVERLSRITSLP